MYHEITNFEYKLNEWLWNYLMTDIIIKYTTTNAST